MPTILILHGWGSCAKKWHEVKEILTARGLKVIVPDLPGFGENPAPTNPWAVDDYVEWVKKFSQDFAPFFLLGHSFGGRLAVQFAAKYPEKILGLILSGAPAIKKEAAVKNFTVKILSKFSFIPFYQFFRKIFYKYLLKKTDYILLQGAMKETFKKIVSEDLSSYLPQIKAKTLLLWGDEDDYVPVKLAYLIKEKIPDSKLIIFPEVKHSPHLEIPEKLSEILANFIQ